MSGRGLPVLDCAERGLDHTREPSPALVLGRGIGGQRLSYGEEEAMGLEG
jgi:hypothetical protein